jgi:hypothetical protein
MTMEYVMAVMMGMGLAAAAGFRVFVPMLVIAIASQAGWINLGPGFAWMGTTAALVTFAVATTAEIAAYKIPWVDNALDTVTTPAAVIAGTVAAASQFGFVGQGGDLLKWVSALVAGGGAAAGVQLLTVTARAASTATTGGLANPIVSIFEGLAAIFVSFLAVLLPLAIGLFLLGIVFAVIGVIWYRRRKSRKQRDLMAMPA